MLQLYFLYLYLKKKVYFILHKNLEKSTFLLLANTRIFRIKWRKPYTGPQRGVQITGASFFKGPVAYSIYIYTFFFCKIVKKKIPFLKCKNVLTITNK